MTFQLPDPATPFGERVARRLRDERLIWFTTVDAKGTPQPTPVWFLWDEATSTILVYSRADAKRLAHIQQNPRVVSTVSKFVYKPGHSVLAALIPSSTPGVSSAVQEVIESGHALENLQIAARPLWANDSRTTLRVAMRPAWPVSLCRGVPLAGFSTPTSSRRGRTAVSRFV